MSGNQGQKGATLEGKPKKPLDIFGFVRRYGLIIGVGGLAILTMLAPLVLKVASPNYGTSALLRIDPVVASLITKSEEPSIMGYYQEYVKTQTVRLTNYSLLKEVLDRLSKEDRDALLPAHLTNEECIPILQAIVRIELLHRTHLVRLSIQGPRKTGLAPVLNTIMEVYLERVREDQVNRNRPRLAYLAEKKEELTQSIEQQETVIQKLATEISTSTFVEDFNVWQERASDLQKSYVHVFSERIKAQNADAFQKKLTEEEKKLSLQSLIDEGVMDDRAIGFTSSWTYEQLQDMRASIDGVTRENEDRKRVESRMQAMRDYEKKLREETRDSIESIMYGKRDLQLARQQLVKENKAQEILQNEVMLKEALEEAREKSGATSVALLDGQAMQARLNHDKELLFRIDTRIHEMEAESRAAIRASVESPAREPENPAGSNTKKLLMLCVMLSFGSIGGLFAAIEFFDNRLHGPKDLVHAFGHPPCWPISKTREGVEFLKVFSQDSHSVAAKALRSLAIRLFREFEKKQSQVVLFTSVDRRSGATEIMMNTAQALAQHVSRVLVVDGNLMQEDLFEKLEIDTAHPGLNELLADENSLSECIYHDSVRSVDFICSREFTPSRTTVQKLKSFLDEARTTYDIICIDSCPVRTSDFTEYLAAHADVGVLISQGESTYYRDLRHTAEILVRLEIPALAIVLNWGGEKRKFWLDEYLDRAPAQLNGMRKHKPVKGKQKSTNDAKK